MSPLLFEPLILKEANSMKLKQRLLNRLKRHQRPNRLNENPLEMGRLTAWHNPNRIKDQSKDLHI